MVTPLFRSALFALTGALMLAMAAPSLADNFGPQPVNYEDTAESYIEGRLHNARGARIKVVSDPYRVYTTMSGYEGLACWAVDMKVASRLPSGGFGRAQRYTVLFLDGQAIALEGDARKVTRL